MSRRRRLITAGRPYEIVFRVRVGIPFPPNDVMNLILMSVVARVQRNFKVKVCHMIWMGNHVHIVVVVMDAEDCTAFYGEIQKQLTDIVKRLLGLDFLHMWEGTPMVAQILDAEKMLQRIAYLYANPSRAHLVDSIEHYPGVSSYKSFKEHFGGGIEDTTSETIPWIRSCKVKRLGTTSLSHEQERSISRKLIADAKHSHTLTYYPNAWMECFGIDKSQVKELNQRIETRILCSESLSRQERNTKGFKPIGSEKLKRQPIMKEHTPKSKGRKPFFLASCKEARMWYLHAADQFERRCRECYLNWKRGDFSLPWPPGAFRPPMGILANAIT